MLGVIINALGVVIGGTVGAVFGGAIKEKYTGAIITVMGLVMMMIGIQSTLGTNNILICIVCLVIGTLIGAALDLDRKMNGAADKVKVMLSGTKLGRGRFAEAFVTTTILFCVGSMVVIGSITAGLNHDYSILITKTIMDFVSAIAFAAALGPGVLMTAVSVLVIEGGLVLLAGVAQPILTTEVVTEMTAVGGVVLFGLSFNIMGFSEKKIQVGDMIPSLLLPVIYFQLKALIENIL